MVFEACLPGRPPQNIGVLVVDPKSNRGWVRFRETFQDIAGHDDAEVLTGLENHFQTVIACEGANAWMGYLGDTLSNNLRIAAQANIRVNAFTRTLDLLFNKHVQKIEPQPYRTHLPLFSMRAAAGFIGDEMRPEEEDWVRAPESMRLDKDLVVVHVVGRSMEPRIPDGSLNIFRLNPVGSRQNKILLIQRRGVFDETAGCTVKRYTSVKVQTGEDEWRHERIRLEPLNPEYDPWDVDPEGFDVIAEWIRVIE